MGNSLVALGMTCNIVLRIGERKRKMSTTIRISETDKKQLELLATIENISEREALSRAVGFYELALMKEWLKQGNFEWTDELIEAFEKARQWLQKIGRLDKRKFKQLVKAKAKGD